MLSHLSNRKEPPVTTINYRTADVDGLTIFYREAGARNAAVLLLLHGFPSASHMFRDLIPLLADRFRLIAAIYVFDYGAPIGFRLAVKHAERITAIITQNGNAYLEGVSEAFNPIQTYWKAPNQKNRDALRGFLAPETTLLQYTHGVRDPSRVSPDGRSLDDFYLARAGNTEIQLDLFLDYQSNIAAYGDFQSYFRTHRRRYWRFGVRTTRSSYRPAPKPSGAIFPTPRFSFSTLVT
jgi:pimeloyl-ACP methyl ester carboxylesterase